MNNEPRTNNAFTLIELVVTVAILTMVISFTSVIFNVSIDAHRTSAASAEIMQKFRAITDQLNRDFRSLQKDAPLLIWFREDANFIENNRFDQIMFFAAGDFQSTQLYFDPTPPPPPGNSSNADAFPDVIRGTAPVIGNVARIHYAQAQPDPNLLARRRHILSADSKLVQWPDATDIQTSFELPPVGFGVRNEVYEHDSLSLAQWKTIPIGDYDFIVPTCFYERPWVDKGDPNTFHKLMCEGVGSFAIQWAYWCDKPVFGLPGFRWFPSEDPDGDNDPADSHFGPALMNSYQFGVHFNIPDAYSIGDWHIVEDTLYESGTFDGFYPRALKFTFTLYDSKGIIKNGREFTHIVYLGD